MFPVVLYNGSERWGAEQDIFDLIRPEPPEFLRVYQPHLRYYLVDEGRYTDEELGLRPSPLSGVFGVENAGDSWEALQRAVVRIAAIIRADPDKERMDRVITRWIKRHLHRLGAAIDLEQLNSLVEDKDMLAENLENLVKKERLVGRQEGRQEGLQEGERLHAEKTALNMIARTNMDDATIAEMVGLTRDEVARLRTEQRH